MEEIFYVGFFFWGVPGRLSFNETQRWRCKAPRRWKWAKQLAQYDSAHSRHFWEKFIFFCVGFKYLFTILASSFSHWPHLGTLFVIVGLVENKLATSDGRTTVARK